MQADCAGESCRANVSSERRGLTKGEEVLTFSHARAARAFLFPADTMFERGAGAQAERIFGTS